MRQDLLTGDQGRPGGPRFPWRMATRDRDVLAVLDALEVRLPTSTREAVRKQIALTFQPPYETPITVAVNVPS